MLGKQCGTPRLSQLVVRDESLKMPSPHFRIFSIFSIVALSAVTNDFFEPADFLFICLTNTQCFGIVIITFVRWVES